MVKDLRIIFWFLRPYRLQVFLIFFFLFILSALETASIGAFYPLLNSVLLKDAIPAGTGGRALEFLSSLARRIPAQEGVVASSIFLLLMVSLSAAFGLFAESYAMWHRYKLLEHFLDRAFAKITGNRYLYFLEKRQGRLIYIGLNTSQAVGEMLMYFPKVGVEFFRLATMTILLLTISPPITLSVLALILLFGALVHLLSMKVIHPIVVDMAQADSAMTAVFTEAMAGIKQIKIFDSRGFWQDRFREQVRRFRMSNTKNAVAGFIPSRLIMVFGALSVAVSIVYVKLTVPDRLSVFLPLIAIYVLSLQRMMPAVNNIGSYWMGLKGLAPRLEVIYATLTDTEHLQEEGKAVFPGLRESLRVEDLSFSYPTRAGVLKGVSLDIPKGKTLAVVGESGSGKSTLADLLLRIYEPSSGRICAGGADIRGFSLASWLGRIGMVTQDTFVFHASIRENIRMGKPSAGDEEVRGAARLAHADAFIAELPEGYDPIVGDRGVKLSGGQRQRIAIARAVLRDPD
ncbi:MAG: ABC transporter ATP-binding protein, partial [Elusimicrobiota bacterium]